ncbi:MAG TPA: hypothetical protein VD815_09785 [Candidatus Saccharimonadales bacterium]|nr:hypothetical protein [Candidatus Saccharimonadales bacterium]
MISKFRKINISQTYPHKMTSISIMNRRTIIFSIALFAIMSPLFLSFDFIVMGLPITTPECASDFWSKTCCWLDNEGGVIRKHCQTCLSDGYGGYTINCETTKGPITKTFGDIYKIPNRGPASQDTPQSETNEQQQQQGDVLQGDPVIGNGTPADGTSQPETSEKRQGGIIGNWGLLKTNQDNEATMSKEENDMIEEQPPAAEEIQTALVEEESVLLCQEGQVFNEETDACILEEPEADETEQK